MNFSPLCFYSVITSPIKNPCVFAVVYELSTKLPCSSHSHHFASSPTFSSLVASFFHSRTSSFAAEAINNNVPAMWQPNFENANCGSSSSSSSSGYGYDRHLWRSLQCSFPLIFLPFFRSCRFHYY